MNEETAKSTDMQAMAESMIEIIDMHKWFGDFHVLRGIDLTIHKKERIVICGPSGSGKSTLIRCINRLEEHQRGKIIVDGIELTNDLKNIEKIRAEVGMVFQHFNLFPHLTMRLIILPQALKIVIPPSVQQLISAFKDTSLVVIIALFDVLRTTQTVLSDPKWMGFSAEAYIFVALIYFLCCFFMANYSRKLEKELSTEEH